MVLLCGLCALAACGGDAPPEESLSEVSDAVFPSAAVGTRYYNDYLGIILTVPDGWTLRGMENLSETPGELKFLGDMVGETYADGASGYPVADLWSRAKDTDPAHAQMTVFCDVMPEGTTAEAYCDTLKTAYVGSFPDSSGGHFTSTYTAGRQVSLSGKTFTQLTFQTVFAEGDVGVTEEYYVSEVYPGQFLVLHVNYWTDEEASYNAAMYALEAMIAVE
ncbi:hypothetical protein LJC32_00450 [Oscillospiraceae bacterium OttesenSCG-928-F05]|nr:hypothetical protein [Oscillospiraceae bacterium OttesenSCG-928-F05]